MKAEILIDNLKCGGCASTITKGLQSLTGIKQVEVDMDHESVKFEADDSASLDLAKEKLRSLGYPEHGTVEGFDKLTAGARSFVSCAVGRLNK